MADGACQSGSPAESDLVGWREWAGETGKERETDRGKEEDKEREMGIEMEGGWQPSALSNFSVDLDEFVLTTQERVRQHLLTRLHTNKHTKHTQPPPGMDEQESEGAGEGVSKSK